MKAWRALASRGWFWPVALGLGVCALALMGTYLLENAGRIAAIWLANGLVIVVLLNVPFRSWPLWLIPSLLGLIAASLAQGTPPSLALVFGLGNGVEILAAALGTRVGSGAGPFRLDDPRTLWRFLAFGGVLAPAAAGLAVSGFLHLTADAPFLLLLKRWVLADGLGNLIMVPLVTLAGPAEAKELLQPRRWLPMLGLIILAAAFTHLVLASGHVEWLFLLSPILALAVFGIGLFGGSLILLVAALAGVMTLAFPTSPESALADPRGTVTYLQLILAANVLVFLPVGSLFRALREMHGRLQTMIDVAPEGVIVWDLDRNQVQIANRTALKQFGHSREDLTAEALVVALGAVDGEQDAPPGPLDGLFLRALAGEVVPFERIIHARDGRSRHGEFQVVRLPADGQRLVMLTIVDATGQKQAERDRLQLQVKLDQAQRLDSIGRLAGGVAHDFNNMLGVILSSAELGLEEPGLPERVKGNLTMIRKATLRSTDLTRQLLAFARQQPASPRSTNLNQAIDSMLHMLRRIIGEDIRIQWQPEQGLWTTFIDPGQVDQVLANLLVNARDAIAGSGTVRIGTGNATVDAQFPAQTLEARPGEYVVLSVEDSGQGMAPETLARIFEPFFTTKAPGKGTGLGLATVHGIVHQNGGFLNVTSEPGKGTAFRIYLPRHDADEAGPVAVPQRKAAAAQGHGTLLLVEDNEDLLAATSATLEAMGYRVLAAASPEAALDLAAVHASEIRLVLSDVVMPGLNGKELLARLRQIRPDLECLFMSGYPAEVIALKGFLEARVNFLQKPFTLADLANKLQDLLGRSESEAG